MKNMRRDIVDICNSLRGHPYPQEFTAGGNPLRYTDPYGNDYFLVLVKGRGPDKDVLRVAVSGKTREEVVSRVRTTWNDTYDAVKSRERASSRASV